MSKKYLVVAKNTDGRPCCWAQSESLDAAKASVDARWPTHGGSGDGCYPGEQRGETEVHLVTPEGAIVPHVE